ncbi:MAG: large conductance mechanosensitive channel protein MscL [Oscillospiraceae bacterium]|nr:large conductance mechanosensitive channel protein MscL [Oscillospiraceae bacterium]MBR4193129.1 large conductance mechanosensitive channel protein MscL [Oscillospiraceae bacterium]
MAEEKKGFIQEFKEFAISGNMFDMAVGIIIGGVFKDLVASFTENIIMPIIGIFTGGIDFSQWKIEMPSLFQKAADAAGIEGAEATAAAEEAGNFLNYGKFISSIISFLILMLVVFLMVKSVNKLRKAVEAKKAKEEEPAPEPDPEPSAEEKLLIEIRDLLAEKK